MKKVIFFAIAVLLLIPSISSAQLKKVIIMKVGTDRVSPAKGKLVRNSLKSFISTQDGFELMNEQEVDQVEIRLQVKGNKKKTFELGTILHADYILIGAISKPGQEFELVIRLLEVKTRKEIARNKRVFKKSHEIKAVVETIAVSAIEEIGDQEKKSNLNFYTSLNAGYFSPIRSNVVNYAFGVTAEAGMLNLFFDNFSFGIESGFVYFIEQEREDVNSSYDMFMVPVQAVFGYKIPVSDYFYAKPVAGIGASFIKTDHFYSNLLWKTGIETGLTIFELFLILARIEYWSIEKSHSIKFSIGVSYVF
ncbi:MAG: hypothetical protein GY754_23235 [bacterium]|nr:hypothetical protein [bacterium]